MKVTVQPRSDAKKGGRIIPLFSLISLIILLLPLLAACSGDEEVSPAEVLDRAIPAMKALEGFSFTYEVTRPQDSEPVPGTDVVALKGAVNAEGSMKAGIDLVQSGIPLHINFVAVGDTHYVQNPLTQRWQSVAAADSPVGALNLGASAIQILERIQEPSYEGREELDGADCHRIKGAVAARDVEGIAQAVSVEGDFPVEVWVGVKDDLVRRITLEGAATAKEPKETVRTIELQRFNEPVEIETPS